MTQLLIHSMAEYSSLIMPCLKAAEVRTIVEIGAEFGGMSQLLAEHAEANGGTLTSIDPAPKPEFRKWVAANRHVRHIAKPSLEAMPAFSDVDAWVIDGDHNYYTVSRELAIADRLSQRDGRPLLAFLHDVSWPCARRDMYYDPSRIPEEHRQPFSWDCGVNLDDDGSTPGRGFRGHGNFAYALRAGGERNGVLTAVEDFLVTARADGRELAFALVPAVFGLGVVFAADAPWSPRLAEILLPMHDNPLIARLEENRLRNFLEVMNCQDTIYAINRQYAA
jgi:hypothetical protein